MKSLSTERDLTHPFTQVPNYTDKNKQPKQVSLTVHKAQCLMVAELRPEAMFPHSRPSAALPLNFHSGSQEWSCFYSRIWFNGVFHRSGERLPTNSMGHWQKGLPEEKLGKRDSRRVETCVAALVQTRTWCDGSGAEEGFRGSDERTESC